MEVAQEFYGANAGYVAELYDRYQQNPASVDAETRAFFDRGEYVVLVAPTEPSVTATQANAGGSAALDIPKIVGAARLARFIRELGHLDAHIDPLGAMPPGDVSLSNEAQGLTIEDLKALPPSVVGGPLARKAANAAEAVEALRKVYSGSVGYEDDHIQNAEERAWLRDAVETQVFFQRNFGAEVKKDLLMRLTEVDTFEQFLQKVPPFQGQKRFSIEGLDVMVPMLDAIMRCTAHAGTHEVVMGMAHRGRLNVLAHVLGKPYEALLAEFPNPASAPPQQVSVSGTSALGYMGDVKYHKGYTREFTDESLEGGAATRMPITLTPNPSHLEFVNPAVAGRARAAQETRDHAGAPVRDSHASLAIMIHGDAAFPGQGVVAETLNLSQLRGYDVGGTIHIIANNQIGFTTLPGESRSTLYASDLAKGFEIPIVHVNGDDALACIAVSRMACAYREKFGKDFLIDLIGYRRLGHNETDEPAFTQPLMYETIRAHPRPREVWAKTLEAEGVVSAAEADAMVADVFAKLQAAKAAASLAASTRNPDAPEFHDNTIPPTSVGADELRQLNTLLATFPPGFAPADKLAKTFFPPRVEALDKTEPAIIWGHAEALAFGAILEDGTPIRLTGQDAQRGTFGHRNLMLHDPNTGATFCPLHSDDPTLKASFAVVNSPLSETAALGFEYGYSVHATNTLVIWEAQYGDFANGAQVIIDQFVASGYAKWKQSPSVVLLLPHGYEGGGPEHSSARLERYLQLCAGDNMRVVNCSNAGQYFHLLRRQAAQLESDPRPLVVMSPKSLLRHPRAAASLADLTGGAFQPVLDDPRSGDPARNAGVTRLVLCTGKIYVDLRFGSAPAYAERLDYVDAAHVAVARVEELNPVPVEELRRLIAGYPNLTEIVWVQEEPKNNGAWSFLLPYLQELLPHEGVSLRYIGRPVSASPSEGGATAHNVQQKRILAEAFTGATTVAIAPPTPSQDSNGKNGSNGAKNGSNGTNGSGGYDAAAATPLAPGAPSNAAEKSPNP